MAKDGLLEHWETVWGCHMGGHSAIETADISGVSTGTVLNYWRRMGLKPGPQGSKRYNQPEPTLRTDHEGYVLLHWTGDPTYESMVAVAKKKRGSVRRCRWAMSKHLGRIVRPDETVHHLNGDRSDDRIENLELRQGAHGPGVALRCASCGSIDLEPA